MKIKANNKFIRLDSATVPCSRVEYHQLRDGKTVEVDDSVGKELINNGFADKVGSKKSKSKEKK